MRVQMRVNDGLVWDTTAAANKVAFNLPPLDIIRADFVQLEVDINGSGARKTALVKLREFLVQTRRDLEKEWFPVTATEMASKAIVLAEMADRIRELPDK